MRALRIHGYGGPEVMRLDDVPVPAAGKHQLLVKVQAASVNPIDWKMRSGMLAHLFPLSFPRTLGRDCAGEAEGRLIAGVADPRTDGTHAESAVISENQLAPVPAGLDAAAAASLCIAGLSAWIPLVELAKVTRGMRVLVHGGAGGVGSLAIQIAKILGLHVITTTSTKNIELVTSLGADEVVDYTTTDFADVLSGYDVVLDSLGGTNLAKSLTVLKRGGLAISVVGPPDAAFARQLGQPILRPVMAVMSAKVRRQARKLGVRYSFFFMRASGAQLRELAALYDAGHLRPVLDKRSFPFDQTPDALAYVEQGKASGKVVIAL